MQGEVEFTQDQIELNMGKREKLKILVWVKGIPLAVI